jgi:pimeloyl-ACP methyl ester carboxylesterase
VNANLPADDDPAATAAGDASDNHIELIVPSNQGVIFWQDVATAVAQSLRLDQHSMQKLFPAGQIDLQADGARLVLLGLDLALGDGVSIAWTRQGDQPPALCLRINRAKLGLQASRKWRPATIDIDDDWQLRTTNGPLLVCLHGLHGGPSVFAGLRMVARSAGYGTATVAYDDRQALRDSASTISDQFNQLLAAASENVRLMLVGHSMGGLIAREWTDNRSLNGAPIAGLITIGAPHGGSNWAALPPLLDLLVAGKLDARRLADLLLHQPSTPGFRDLAPGSQFLQQLAARRLRDEVRYTTILGTGSPVDQQTLESLQQILRRLDREGSLVRWIRPRIQPLLESFDELVPGKGDGAVAVARATIPGVEDVVIVDCSHGQLLRPPTDAQPQTIWQAILTRIERL